MNKVIKIQRVLKLSVFRFSLILLASSLLLGSLACGARPEPEVQNKFSGKGVVKSVQPEAGTVSIDHEEIKGLMSAMTMTFTAKEKSLLDGISVNDKVDFTLERVGSEFTLTDIKRAR